MAGVVFFSKFCSSQWHSQLKICGGDWTRWFWYGDGVLHWWIHSHLIARSFCCLIALLPWLQGQGANILTSHLDQGVRISFLGPAIADFEESFTSSSLIPSQHLNRLHPLMSLTSYLLQSLQGFNTWLIPFLIILNCRLLIASIVINYGARLEHYICL